MKNYHTGGPTMKRLIQLLAIATIITTTTIPAATADAPLNITGDCNNGVTITVTAPTDMTVTSASFTGPSVEFHLPSVVKTYAPGDVASATYRGEMIGVAGEQVTIDMNSGFIVRAGTYDVSVTTTEGVYGDQVTISGDNCGAWHDPNTEYEQALNTVQDVAEETIEQPREPAPTVTKTAVRVAEPVVEYTVRANYQPRAV